MKRAMYSFVTSLEPERQAPAKAQPRARKVPQLTKGQVAFHKGTSKSGSFSLENALDLYKPKASK